MERVPRRIPVATMAELTSARLVAYFEFGGGSRKTYNNRWGTMSGFLKFALQREWITENPLTKIPAHRIRRSRSGAQTLTVETAENLMEFVETTTRPPSLSSPYAFSVASGLACARVKSCGSSPST